MFYKLFAARWVAICVAGALSACGLLPSDSEHLSSAEKAALNVQMGVRYMEMGMLETAEQKLEAAYRLDSHNPEILNALAIFYERVKNYERAEEFYQAAVREDPDNYSIKNNYGRLLCERGQVAEGMALLEVALDSPMNQRTWLALSNVGICYLGQNDVVQGESYLRRALQANPEYSPALQAMMKLSYNNGQYMSARAFLERYQSVAKHSAETLWFAFQIERALGNQSAAEHYKEQLLTLFPTSKQAQAAASDINK
ncbi:type IV pilus biogenesis/stability protein PilW [Methylomonas rhizoryzae]|uniref:type IV pilus biogenesis/stability protein PilW n=1 Tax=Methylomonas rhizoryzae TaxID=2608981 RepID=UPI00123215FB|nr:type IV pilus biogenesis/stability protein PilW [Methylomonas rhizoryzae]